MVVILKTGYNTYEVLKIIHYNDLPQPLHKTYREQRHHIPIYIYAIYNSIGLLEQIPPTTTQNMLIQKHVVLQRIVLVNLYSVIYILFCYWTF